MAKPHSTLLAIGSAAALLVTLSGCSMLSGGDDDAGGGFTDITNEIAQWDMCEVLPIEPIKEQVKAETYINEPHHVGLGSSMNAEAISCAGDIEVQNREDSSVLMNVTLSVFPGNSAEHVDDMWELRQGGFYEDVVETNSYDLTAEDLFIDTDIEGAWDSGHAYVIMGTEGDNSGETGQLIVDVRTGNYIVEVWLDLPNDPEKSAAASYGLSQEEIDSKTSLAFDREAFAAWVVDEHITTMFDAVTSKLDS